MTTPHGVRFANDTCTCIYLFVNHANLNQLAYIYLLVGGKHEQFGMFIMVHGLTDLGCIFSWGVLVIAVHTSVLHHAPLKRERKNVYVYNCKKRMGRPSSLLCFILLLQIVRLCATPLHIRPQGTVNCSSTQTGDRGGYHTTCCVPVGVHVRTPSDQCFAIQGIQSGFKVGFSPNPCLCSAKRNMHSAQLSH